MKWPVNSCRDTICAQQSIHAFLRISDKKKVTGSAYVWVQGITAASIQTCNFFSVLVAWSAHRAGVAAINTINYTLASYIRANGYNLEPMKFLAHPAIDISIMNCY